MHGGGPGPTVKVLKMTTDFTEGSNLHPDGEDLPVFLRQPIL